MSCTSCRCFPIYEIGVGEVGLETESQQRKPPLFLSYSWKITREGMIIASAPPIEELYCKTIAGARMSTVFLSVLLRLFTLPTGSAPIQLEPIVISPLPLHQTNTNGFSAESIALYTSCSPLLARFMADKGQPPTLSFLNVPVTKMFLLLSSSRSNTEVKKLSRNR